MPLAQGNPTQPGQLRTIGLTVALASTVAAAVALAAGSFWFRPSSTASVGDAGRGATVAQTGPSTEAVQVANAPKPSTEPSGPHDSDRLKIPIGNSPTLGPSDALVTVVVFANFQCPASRSSSEFLENLVDRYPNDLRLVWKENPLAIHTRAEAASEVAREALDRLGPDGFWKTYKELFSIKHLDDESLLGVAKRVGLDPDDAQDAIRHSRHQSAINADLQLVDDFGVNDTPYVFINGRPFTGSTTHEEMDPVIQAELEHARTLVAQGTPRSRVYETILAQAQEGIPMERKDVGAFDNHPSYGALDNGTGVVMAELCDYTNPFCSWIDPVVEQLLQKYHGQLQVIWFDVPDPKDEDAVRAAELAREAFAQGGESAYLRIKDLLLDHPKGFGEKALMAYAKKAGLDTNEVHAALQDHRHRPDIISDIQRVKAMSVEFVPAFLVSSTRHPKDAFFLNGAHPVHSFERRIEAALAER